LAEEAIEQLTPEPQEEDVLGLAGMRGEGVVLGVDERGAVDDGRDQLVVGAELWPSRSPSVAVVSSGMSRPLGHHRLEFGRADFGIAVK